MDLIVNTACDLLHKRVTFVLATIVSHAGSTPRTSSSRIPHHPIDALRLQREVLTLVRRAFDLVSGWSARKGRPCRRPGLK